MSKLESNCSHNTLPRLSLIAFIQEDIPEDVDDSIKTLLQLSTSKLSAMEFLVDEDYLDYKAGIAAKKATEKKLPRSKGRSARK
jgi:hypothetical protein